MTLIYAHRFTRYVVHSRGTLENSSYVGNNFLLARKRTATLAAHFTVRQFYRSRFLHFTDRFDNITKC